MPTIAAERTADELIASWRLGLDEDGWDNPAGPKYIGGHVEFEIVDCGMGTTKDAPTMGTGCTAGICRQCC